MRTTTFWVAIGMAVFFMGCSSSGGSPSPDSSVQADADLTDGAVDAAAVDGGPDGAVVPPCDGVSLAPGDDIQAAVEANAAGTVFCIQAGTHRLQEVVPKDDMVFVGESGAVLSGAQVLTGWTASGGAWYVDGQVQQQWAHGICEDSHPRCDLPEDLYIDDVLQRHVASVGEVGPGTWFFDYDADRIYLGEDPSGKTVETNVTNRAFSGGAANVEIWGLVVEKYANQAQHGAIDARVHNGSDSPLGVGWLVQLCEVRFNHGTGIRVSDLGSMIQNHVHHNGQKGVGANGPGILVEGNEIHHNNTVGFSWGWEGGGSKFSGTTDLVVRGNHVHHNVGPGLWTDIDNVDTLYEHNVVEDNLDGGSGIFHEISWGAIIRYNEVRRNGLPDPPWLWGAGILIAASGDPSGDLEIHDNFVEGNGNGIALVQQERGTGDLGPYLVQNVWVHDNTVIDSGGTGAVQDTGDSAIFTSRNLRFEGNDYVGDNVWAWDNGWHDFTEWQAYGHDVTGSSSP